MDVKEFKKAIELLKEEKGIDEDTIYDAMELALTSAYKKNYKTPHSAPSNVRVDINRETGEIKVFSFKTVVDPKEEEKYKKFSDIDFSDIEDLDDEEGMEDIPVLPFQFDPNIHLTLEEARKIDPTIELGETIEEEVTPKDFGRVAAATAKQVVVQKIREAERNIIIQEFEDKEDEMMVGTVAMEDQRNYYVDLGRTQGILPKAEIIPGEEIKMGSSIKVYVSKVENGAKGPFILLSRKHYGFVKRLFELEIPEVNDGTILVYSVAREAGIRTKIAVYSEVPNVDPVGSCIGEHGSRINNIIKELNGEKIDVVPYNKDISKFIENALSPAKNLSVFVIDDKKKEAMVVVDEDNLSLAIGKKGLNIRLASRLTHFKLDIKTRAQAEAEGIHIL